MALAEPAFEMKPLEYLAAADRALTDGHDKVAAGLLAKAADATFLNLARLTELDAATADPIEVARALEGNKSLPQLAYRSNRIAASLLQDHAAMDVLEADELESAYEVVRKFVLRCQSELPGTE